MARTSLPFQVGYSRDTALRSLARHDPDWPVAPVTQLLARPENDRLLGYVWAEAFTHVFPGDRSGHPPGRFFEELDAELRRAPAFHLWAEIPLCRYRCHFCQFPILVLNHDPDDQRATARRWIDANIAEAQLWLDRVPALRSTPVGELCIFGGTPTTLPMDELRRLVDFYLDTFTFTESSSLRVEGSPDSLTPDVLGELAKLGFATLTFGVQSFDDELLRIANRRHTGQHAVEAIGAARQAGFGRVDGDLVWGLPGQSVAGFLADVRRMISLLFSTVVIIKLHLRSFHTVDTAIGHVRHAPWEDPSVRDRLDERGFAWPPLGEQYQMRQQAVALLEAAGYVEHPTTYFPEKAAGPEIWRSLNLDQDKQYPQVGIGLGAYTWSSRSEANVVADPRDYMQAIASHEIPFGSVTAISDEEREVRAVRMALSTCQDLADDVHRARFPGSSLLGPRWRPTFDDLEGRGLAVVDERAGTVALTPDGKTLVEAIINTEVR